MDAVRTFFAIEIPPFAIATISEVQNHFKSIDLNASWVRPANIHLTLRFLGNIDPRKLPKIKQAVQETLAPVKQFTVTLGAAGVFPNFRKPRVLWIGLEEQTGALEDLHHKLEGALDQLGFEKDSKKFSPHLTLARIKSPKGKEKLKDEVKKYQASNESFEVSSVKLFQSQLTPKGSIYTVLEEFSLSG